MNEDTLFDLVSAKSSVWQHLADVKAHSEAARTAARGCGHCPACRAAERSDAPGLAGEARVRASRLLDHVADCAAR